jgi:hypothetical protein
MYPQLDTVMRRANDARAMVLDQARQQLNPNQQEENQ